MRLIICDDVQEDAFKTKELIEDYNIKEFTYIDITQPDILLKEIDNKTFDYDIIILDIEYHRTDLNGIELGRRINEYAPLCNIIYLSDVPDFASDVYETKHCYFVMKKNQHITLKRALEKALEIYYENNDKCALHIICNYNDVYLSTKIIQYITRENRKLKIIADKTYECYMGLNDCKKQLPKKFVRCHTGYIINADYIKSIESNKICMMDNREIPIGRVYKDSFMLHYLEYLGRRI
ncbi:MAG: LytTR family transcriptional regulator DNA-binding domain-containing protein [Lachnospiraceae bacterium]|nr:LytTR family transcriptional regulator DNA-binding domain-containing protein [Lachnospiraceae bacterium]